MVLVANIVALRIEEKYTEYYHRMNKYRDSTAVCKQNTKSVTTKQGVT